MVKEKKDSIFNKRRVSGHSIVESSCRLQGELASLSERDLNSPGIFLKRPFEL